jgi:DNA-binding response OmpR family regulator
LAPGRDRARLVAAFPRIKLADQPTVPTILCIDAKPTALAVWEKCLQDAGFTVIATPSGAEGIEIFQKQAPDMVVVDLKSRDVHGAEVARRMKAHNPVVPIILLCGSYWWPPEAALQTVNALVIKGDGGAALVAKVRELLASPGPPKPAAEIAREESERKADRRIP